VAGNFSGYWLGISIVGLMAVAYFFTNLGADGGYGLGALMVSPVAAPVFGFGLVAFGFLGMGPVTIAVDSYGPVTDNAQSVFELSVIESLPGIEQSVKKEFGLDVRFDRAKDLLEENDGAGNTFKATAKPVLIGTAVVGATTMVFGIIMMLQAHYRGIDPSFNVLERLSLVHPEALMGLLVGALTSGFAVAVFMANAGGAWDNAKKYIEAGHHGGKGSDAHKAAVVGDTVGDPFKDTSGPSLNILIKLMSMVAVVFAGVIVKFGPIIGDYLGIG
jgi:K(+)-stimulated pyrophosphate-energized sodium pump